MSILSRWVFKHKLLQSIDEYSVMLVLPIGSWPQSRDFTIGSARVGIGFHGCNGVAPVLWWRGSLAPGDGHSSRIGVTEAKEVFTCLYFSKRTSHEKYKWYFLWLFFNSTTYATTHGSSRSLKEAIFNALAHMITQTCINETRYISENV